MSDRKRTDPAIEAQVLLKSRRRCCLCFYLHNDLRMKPGQLAHLDRSPSNGSESNLAFLCLEHHSSYDSSTSQHKNFTLNEVLAAREALYTEVAKGLPGEVPEKTTVQSSQSGGVNFGVGATVQVYGDIVGGHKTQPATIETLRERGEELHGLIDKWLND
ncbi:MAG TPA: hypothetical protein VKT49_08475, partial [Bryobacteraceae bacterium]|nr:hypothetical protein [Bryobacteraceae bacterium]